MTNIKLGRGKLYFQADLDRPPLRPDLAGQTNAAGQTYDDEGRPYWPVSASGEESAKIIEDRVPSGQIELTPVSRENLSAFMFGSDDTALPEGDDGGRRFFPLPNLSDHNRRVTEDGEAFSRFSDGGPVEITYKILPPDPEKGAFVGYIGSVPVYEKDFATETAKAGIVSTTLPWKFPDPSSEKGGEATQVVIVGADYSSIEARVLGMSDRYDMLIVDESSSFDKVSVEMARRYGEKVSNLVIKGDAVSYDYDGPKNRKQRRAADAKRRKQYR